MVLTGQPAKVTALNALVTVLEGIETGDSYYTEVRRVTKFEPAALASPSDRLVHVLLEGSTFDDRSECTVSQWQTTLRVRIFLVMKTATDIVDELLRFERDVLTAVILDEGSGAGLGGTALKSRIRDANYVIANEKGDTSYAELGMEITLRSPRYDLNASS